MSEASDFVQGDDDHDCFRGKDNIDEDRVPAGSSRFQRSERISVGPLRQVAQEFENEQHGATCSAHKKQDVLLKLLMLPTCSANFFYALGQPRQTGGQALQTEPVPVFET